MALHHSCGGAAGNWVTTSVERLTGTSGFVRVPSEEPLVAADPEQGSRVWGQAEMGGVLFLVTQLGIGGAEVQVCELATLLGRRGWPVQVTSMLPGGELRALLVRRGIRPWSLDMRRGIPDPRGIWRLKRILKIAKCSVLHCNMLHANLLGRLVRLFRSVPVVISSAHSVDEGSGWRSIAYRWTDSLSDLTTNVCNAGVRGYVARGLVTSGRIRRVPVGVDTERFRADEGLRRKIRSAFDLAQEFVWLTACRFEPVKNLEMMLSAFRYIVRRYPRDVLLMAGDGSQQGFLKSQIDKLGLSCNVRLLGWNSNLPDLLNAADCYLLSSLVEGLPTALLEAASTEVPIVTTDVGGVREIVADGNCGLLAEDLGSSGFTREMLSLRQMPVEGRRKLGTNGRDHIERSFSMEVVCTTWEGIYRELLRSTLVAPCAR